MSLESKSGRECKVTIGSDIIVGIGTWSITGGAWAEIEDTAMGDDDYSFIRGIKTGGSIAFAGNYKKDDVTGQDKIRDAYWLKSDLTDLRFYVDDTSYYTPNSTTAAGGGLPAETMISHIKIMTEPNISFDKNGLGAIDFAGKINGAVRLI